MGRIEATVTPAGPGLAAQEGASAPGPQRPTAVTSVTIDTGIGGPSTASAANPNSIEAIFARAQAKLDQSKPAAPPPAETAADDAVAEQGGDGGAADEQTGDVEAGAEAEAPAAEGDAPDDGGTEAPADATAAPAPFEVDQLKADLAAARAELSGARNTRKRETFDAYFEDPKQALRSWLADTLGVPADSPLVQQEARSLYAELTWDEIAAKDLPDDQQAQLSRDRLDRRIRLDSHRRQADQRATQGTDQVPRARELATSVYDTVRAQFPMVPIAELALRRPVAEIIVDALQEGVATGQIKDWQTKSDKDLFTEAARLVDQFATRWADSVAHQLATLRPASAPAAPGASAKTDPQKKTAPSPAAPKGKTAPPRTLPQTKAGAAPSRPATPPKTEPAPLPLDSKARMAAIFGKYK